MEKLYPNAEVNATQLAKPERSSSASIERIRAADPPAIRPTASDERRFCGIRYADRYEYFDTVKYLSKSEISEADQAWLSWHCRRLDIRRHGHWVRPRNGGPKQINIWPRRFRIEIHGPDRAALEFLAKLPDIKVTAVHIARDFTFDDAAGKSAMLDFFYVHYCQRWQRSREWKTFFNRNDPLLYDLIGFSTGRRGKGFYFTSYISKPSRIDGVVDCFHGEGRHHGTAALAQIGIHSPADLLDFDFAKYHSDKDSQSLRAIDKQRLGKFLRNRSDTTRDQQAISSDQRFGGSLWRYHAHDEWGRFSMQQFMRSKFLKKHPALRSGKNIIRRVDTDGARP